LKFIPQVIPDVFLIEPNLLADNRGYFVETFRKDILEDNIGYKINFVQGNESKSTKGVLRGLHYQLSPHAQSKLVRVNEGSVLDVVVDLRKSSSTFGKHFSIVLSSENKFQLFIPRGFAHGFVVLSDEAIFSYKVDNYYSKEHERGILYNDKNLAINWQLPLQQLKLSEKDKNYPLISETSDLFE
jgi:dTDP-4-dehydrorhamnose 3,5-epimerase